MAARSRTRSCSQVQAPTGNVTITMTRTGANSSAISVSPSSLTFTPGNWLTSRTVTVTGVNNRVVNETRTATITHAASGGGYDDVTINDVTVTVTDDDAPTGIRLSVSPDSVPEAGGAKTMTVTATVQGNTTYTEA